MKIVVETEPFGSDENGKDSEEEGVEICVPDRGGKYNGKGEMEVGGKDAAAVGLHAESVTGDPAGVRGGCMVLAEEEDRKSWLVTLGRRGGMVPAGGGDFTEEEDGEDCLHTMIFNFRRMASSLESMEA